MRFLPFVLLFTLPLAAQPARQATNWHFANGIALRFDGGTPVLDPPSAMSTFEGAASLSDTLGNLLFYSNGGGRLPGNGGGNADQDYGTIWNRDHEVLYDMGGVEGGGFSAHQSALAFPAPGAVPDLYYLFTMEEFEFDIGGTVADQPQGRGLSYFTIDMSLNGGLGGVVLADQRVYVPAYEGLDATPMEGTDGYWIVCHNNTTGDNGRLVIVPLTANGVGTPVEVALPGGVGGRIKFSPDGRYLYLRGTVYAFDPASGTVGNVLLEVAGLSDQNATFTPDSRFLYGTQAVGVLSNVVVRYDVATGEQLPIAALEVPGSSSITLVNGPFQIGPDGDIYFVEAIVDPEEDFVARLSEITCVSGAEPTVNRGVVDLSDFRGRGLFAFSPPQFVDAIFRQPVLTDTVVLDTAAVVFCPNEARQLTARREGLSYRWSTGDTTATVPVGQPGTYCVSVSDGCNVFVDCRTTEFASDANDPVVLAAATEDCRRLCTVRLNTEAAFDSINVTLGFDVTTREIEPQFRGTFFTDSLVFPKPLPGESATTPYIRAFVVSGCGVQAVDLTGLPYPQADTFAVALWSPERELCAGETIDLEVVPVSGEELASVRWSDGATANPRSVTLAVDSVYSAVASSVCGTADAIVFEPDVAAFCDCEARIPGLITPNGDGTNDRFGLFYTTGCPVEGYTMRVFNRWGQTVFSSTDPEERWDGTKDGTPVDTDAYLYYAVFRLADGEVEKRDGQVTVVR